jgi:hypothetical protein
MTKQNKTDSRTPKTKKKKNKRKILKNLQQKYQPKHKQSINQSFGFKKSAFIKNPQNNKWNSTATEISLNSIK